MDRISVCTDDTEGTRTDMDLTDNSLFYSSEEEEEATPLPIDDRFVFDIPSTNSRLTASHARHRTSSLSRSFKRARKRVESFGADSSRLRSKIGHFKHKNLTRHRPGQRPAHAGDDSSKQ